MASVLYRIGAWSVHHRRWVVAGWVTIVVVVGVLAVAFKGHTDDAFNVPGTQSQQALDLLNAKFPGTGGADARIVFAAPPGHKLTDSQYDKLVKPTIRLAEQVPQTVGVSETNLKSPLTLSTDQTIGFADIHFAVPVDKLSQQTKDALERVAGPARKAGLEVEFSGGVISTGSSGSGSSDIVGLLIAFVVLYIMFGGLLVAGLPLISALTGVAIGLLGLTALTGVITLNSTTPTLALMLGLAVGIDYALFIVSRHRQHLDEGMPIEESVAVSVATAGSAVCFAGLTVVIALAGLLVVGIPFLSTMGLGAAGTVVLAVLIANTMLPALLGFAGMRAAKRRKPPAEHPWGERWGRHVTRHPVLAIVGVVVILGVFIIPIHDMRLGLPDAGTLPKSSTQYKAYKLLSKGFGAGFNGPLTIVSDADSLPKSKWPQIPGQVARALEQADDVANVSAPIPNKEGDIAIITATPKSGPSSTATQNLVNQIRAAAKQAQSRYHVQVLVTGTTAINLDTSNKLSSALPVFLVLVVGLALLIQTLVFRSLLVPITAVVGFLLTIGAALGATTFVFQLGNGRQIVGIASSAPIISFLPVLLVAILFGLAMDYEVFLVTRMRESYNQTHDANRATIAGFRASARVVTAAAIIMISVFGSFIFGGTVTIASIGFALAFGVLADAFLVRMTFVPAVHTLLGNRAWHLPKWIDRLLPNVDIEGAALTERLDARATPEPAQP
jgi:putative drug exporter of the RND superfamily